MALLCQIQHLRRAVPQQYRSTMRPLLTALACLIVVGGCKSPGRTSESRPDWLAPSAQIMFTSRREDGFLPDAAFKLKAQASETDFQSAVKQLGLMPYAKVPKASYGNEPPQWLGDADKRWDVGPELEDTFIRKEGRWWQLAKRKNGFIYYQSVSY